MEDSNLEIGDKTSSHLNKLSEQCQKDFFLGVWEFYNICTSYLFKLPLTNIIIRCCKVLQPSLRQEVFILKGIWILGKRLLVSVDIDSLSYEWKLYQLDDISLEFFKTKGFNEIGEEILLKERVDHYWRKTELMVINSLILKSGIGQIIKRRFSFIISELPLWVMLLESNLQINLFHHYRKILSLWNSSKL